MVSGRKQTPTELMECVVLMFFTLHRYIFRQLFRVFLLAALALTVMLSLGSVLQPVQEYGVGPRQVLHLMAYFLPVVLTFVLPVAALFAASLVYGRLALDNELDACRASGISMPTLIYPGLTLAIMVAIANLVLSFHVMPVFVHMATKSLKADAKQILFRNLKRRGYCKLPPDDNYLIYADAIAAPKNTLFGVVVVDTTPQGTEEIITARSATVEFDPHEKFNEVRITAQNACRMDSESTYSLGLSSFTAEFGSLLGDEIKFKKLEDMKKIRDVDLMLFDPLARLANRLYARLTTELLAGDINDAMRPDGSRLYRLHSGESLVEFKASQVSVSNQHRIKLSGDIVVREYDVLGQVLLRTWRCRKAMLNLEGAEPAATLTMEMDSPTWRQAGATEQAAWGWIRIKGLVVPADVQAQLSPFRTETGLDVNRLAFEPDLTEKPGSLELERLQRRLQREIQHTLAEIDAETHSRLVFGLGCVPMIVIGIALGITLRGGHLLTAFGASCVPAAVLMVAILTGKNITKNLGSQLVSGTALMWAGFVILILLALGLYRRLSKN